MRKMTALFALILLALAAAASQTAGREAAATVPALPPAARRAMESIDAERIRAHVRFLSHDLLEGRGTGQRGGDLASLYIAAQFALAGLEPAGDDGTYLQKVPLVGVTTQPETSMTILPADGEPMKLAWRDDFTVTNETLTEQAEVDGEVIYLGYGISAPEYGWDDYKDTDVKGKVLLMLVNEPPSDQPDFFKGEALTYYGRWTYKYEEAARRGAAGVLLIHETEMASYPWDVVRNSWTGERSFVRDGSGPALKAAGWIQLEVAQRFAAASGMDLPQMMERAKSRQFKPVPMKARMQARVVARLRRFESENVVARLPGGDARRRDQAVIYSAHHDHLGIQPDKDGDNIYNGAVDNASGTAILLELARAYAGAAQRPPRSILFAAVTAEEQGLRGSEYLGQNPPVPPARIALNLNFDGLNPLGIPEGVLLTGSERTTFHPVSQATAKEFGLEIRPDPRPGAGSYYRSDHFSFARVGVPGFSVNQGRKFRDQSEDWGNQQASDYTANRYHQPGDEYRADMDFHGLATLARFGMALGWRAASLPEPVAWLPGDEFEAARKASGGSKK